jgi:hypothetical protein
LGSNFSRIAPLSCGIPQAQRLFDLTVGQYSQVGDYAGVTSVVVAALNALTTLAKRYSLTNSHISRELLRSASELCAAVLTCASYQPVSGVFTAAVDCFAALGDVSAVQSIVARMQQFGYVSTTVS